MNFGFDFGGGFPGGIGGGRHAASSMSRPPVDTSKFYNLLGVQKDADEATIKKAFRKLAMTHHPDKGGDGEVFKEISKAYEVLSNPEKRSAYDQYGEEGLEGAGGGGGGGGMGMDIFDLFTGGGFGGPRQHKNRKGDDVMFPLKVGLEECYNGTSKKLRLTKNVLCNACNGRGGSQHSRCEDCQGHGIRVVVRRLGPGLLQQMQTTCPTCNGMGQIILEKDRCKKCKGDKTVKDKKTLEVFINKGMQHGQRITFSGEADEAPDMVPGDVVVILQVSDHPLFKRDGSNLFFKKTITLSEALCGFQFSISHLDGRILLISSEPGVIYRPGDWRALVNEGMPTQKNPMVKGNLYIEFDVKFPDNHSLTDTQRRTIAACLPVPTKDPLLEAAVKAHAGGSERVESVNLVQVDINAEKQKFEQQHKEAYDDEDEQRRQYHQGPACRQQ